MTENKEDREEGRDRDDWERATVEGKDSKC